MDNEDKCVETLYVEGDAAKSTLIQRNPVHVHWISFFPKAPATAGVIQIYDGFDAGGKLKWQHEPAYAAHKVFIPPFDCHQGLFIYTSADIGGFTIAWCPVKKEQPAG